MLNPLKFINKIFKSNNEKELDRIKNLIVKINDKENEIKKISNESISLQNFRI